MWQRNMEINTHKKLPPYPYNLQNGGAQMKIKRVKMIIMALGMCVLAACGTKQEADQGAESVTLTGVTRGTAAEVDDGDHTADDGDVPAAENEEPVYTDIACVGGPYGEITVGGHNGWSIEAAPVDSGKLSYGLYGLILKPENAKEGQIEVFCMDGFGVCGTGLETEEITLAGYTAYMGTFDEHEHWDYILIKGEKPEIVAQHTECDSWTDEMWEEALSILDTVCFDEGKTEGGIGQYIPESEDDTIAVIMSVSNVTPAGLTVHFRQYDKRENIKLVYGDGYRLEDLNGDTWEDVPRLIEERGTDEEGNIKLPSEGESELEINWKILYGILTPGTYRITMTMADWDLDNPSVYIPAYPLTAQFIIAGG